MDRTLVICKPDAVERGLVGEVIGRLETKGLALVAAELRTLDAGTLARHYEEHVGKPFYDSLVEFMTSGPVIPMVLEADDAVAKLRDAIGATDPAEAEEGTVRKLFAESKGRNAIHASDSDENAANEIAFFFSHHERLGTQ